MKRLIYLLMLWPVARALAADPNPPLQASALGRSLVRQTTAANMRTVIGASNVDLTTITNTINATMPSAVAANLATNSVVTNAVVAVVHGSTNLAPDLGSLTRFPIWVQYSNNYPMTVLAIGDSLAVPPSMAEQVARRLQQRFGANGTLTDNFLTTEPWPTNSAGAVDAGPDSYWFNRYHRLDGNGANVAWGSSLKPNGYMSDQVELAWIKTPGGADFDLQTKREDGAWTTVKTLPGNNASNVGAYTNVAVTFGHNRVRVINTAAGTNYILFQGTYYTGWGASGGPCGVRFAQMGFGGLSMDAWTNVPAAIKDVILTNLHPALIISHNLEAATASENDWLPEYFRWLNLARYSADIVVVGNYDFGAGLAAEYTTLERQMWFTNAMKNGMAFFNLQTASGGYENMFTNGYTAGTFSTNGCACGNPHPSMAGRVAMAHWFYDRFDLARYDLDSSDYPQFSAKIKQFDTNAVFSVSNEDASGNSTLYINGRGAAMGIFLGVDNAGSGASSGAKSALWGNQNQTVLNSPASDGPYFARGILTTVGRFDTDGRLYLGYGLNCDPGPSGSNYMQGKVYGVANYINTQNGVSTTISSNSITTGTLTGTGNFVNTQNGVSTTISSNSITTGTITGTGNFVNTQNGVSATISSNSITLGMLLSATNYLGANFAPVAGQVKIVISNRVVYGVSDKKTNVLLSLE